MREFSPPLPACGIEEALALRAGNIVRPFREEQHGMDGGSFFRWKEGKHTYDLTVDRVRTKHPEGDEHRAYQVNFSADGNYNRLVGDVDASNVMATVSHAVTRHMQAQARYDGKAKSLHYQFAPSREVGEMNLRPLETKRGRYYSHYVHRAVRRNPIFSGVEVQEKNLDRDWGEVSCHFPKHIAAHVLKSQTSESAWDFVARATRLLNG